MTELENTSKGIDRRTLVKGAAWSVPVIAAAVATPLAAAKTQFPTGAIVVTSACSLVALPLPVGTPTGLTPVGFSVANTDPTRTATVTLSMDANAWGSLSATATNNVNSATGGVWQSSASSGGATASPANLNQGWSGVSVVDLGFLQGYRASKTRTVTLTLPPNSSYSFGKWLALDLVGDPTINAKVTGINGESVSNGDGAYLNTGIVCVAGDL